jgi:hypothetical protein
MARCSGGPSGMLAVQPMAGECLLPGGRRFCGEVAPCLCRRTPIVEELHSNRMRDLSVTCHRNYGKVQVADYCSSSSRALRMSALALRPYFAARCICSKTVT